MRLRQTVLILQAFVLVCAISGCSDPEKREAKYLSRGTALFEKGEYQKARLEFRNAGGLKPTDPEVGYRLGLVDEAEGDLRNAFAGFMQSTQQNAHFKPAQLKVAQYFLAAEQYDQVEAHLNVVLADDPDNADAHALKAALSLRKKNFEDAEKEARFSLQHEAGNITAVSVLSGLYVAKNDEQAATDVLNLGIGLHPDDVSLQVLKVAVYQKFNDIPKVEEAYRTLLKLKPRDSRYPVQFAEFYLTQHRQDDAEAVLRASISSLPDDWDMKHRLVLFLSEFRGVDVAEKEVRAYMAAAPDKGDLYFWLADIYVKHQAIDRAVKLLQEVAEKERFDPPGLNARTSLAKISFARGDRALGQKLVAIVLENAPGNHDALMMRAAMEFDEGRYEGAVADSRSILRDNPHSKEALQLLAETLVRQGHLDLAADTLNQLVDIDPLNMGARVRLAQMLHLNGDTKRALELLALVTKGEPTYSIGWESTARIAAESKDWPLAENAIAKLSSIDGQAATANYLEGMVLVGKGKLEEATQKFSEVVSADPNAPLAEHALASLVAADRGLKKLEAACHFVEMLKTDSQFVLTTQGECYAETGRTSEAAGIFDKAIEGHTNRPAPYTDRARLYLIQHDVAGAVETLKKGVAAVPNDVQIPMLLAELLGSDGQYHEAEAIYEDLLSRNSSLTAAANNLAELIADYQSGDPSALEKARQVAERFQGSKNPLLLDTLGWVYFRQGNLTQAVITLERAVAMGEVPAQVHYHYGAILEKMSRKDDSKTQLEAAVNTKEKYVGIEDAKRILSSL